MAEDKPVTLAAVTGAHGVTGEVRLKLFGEGLDGLKRHKSFNEGALTLAKLRDDGKGGAVARFAEVPDRTAAEALRGTVLTVPRSALPPLDEGEYYHADLIGLAAVIGTMKRLPVGRSISSRSPAPKFSTATTVPSGSPASDTAARPIRSAW